MPDLVGDLGGEWMDGWMDGWMTPFCVCMDGGVGVRRIIDLVQIHGRANIRTHIRMDVWNGTDNDYGDNEGLSICDAIFWRMEFLMLTSFPFFDF